MKTYDYDTMIFPDGMEEKDKERLRNYFRQQANERKKLCVIYHPDCGCEIDSFVVLDRFPMSEKIHAHCPNCKKYCLLEISEPIVFHCQIRDKDFSLEELSKMFITESGQKEFIFAYIRN